MSAPLDRVRRFVWLALLAVGACDDGAGVPADGGSGDASRDADGLDAADGDAGGPDSPLDSEDLDDGSDAPDGGDLGPAYLAALATPDDLAALQAPGASDVKYLARVDGREPPASLTEDCVFQNMRRFSFHVSFLQSFPELVELNFEAYLDLVLRRDTRIWWGGDVRLWPNARHPQTGAIGLMSYTVYAQAEGENMLTINDISEVDGRLEACIPFAAEILVFLPDDLAQQQLVRTQRADLLEAGVVAVLPEELVLGVATIPYSLGEGYGILRRVPADEPLGDYGPRDVVVVKSAPNDISVVAGLITADPQSVHSHVNMRLLEKGIPNAAWPSVYDSALVSELDGFLVHVAVTDEAVTLEPARLEDAETFWEAHQPNVGQPEFELSVTALAGFEDLTHADAIAYGVKAANLGELHAILPAANRNEGFGIPFSAYAAYMEANGLDTYVAEMLATPRLTVDRTYREAYLGDLLRRIRAGALDPDFEAALRARLEEVYGDAATTTRMRFRSSTNAEDLDELTGAGLYDSYSGCLGDDLDGDEDGPSACLSEAHRAFLEAERTRREAELADHPERVWLVEILDEIDEDLTEERTVARAVRRVWASLWNLRAFDERAYYGLDHTRVFMGVAVHPASVMEQLNVAAVTELHLDDGDPVYRVVSQVGTESVVQPVDPTAVAEVQTFRRSGDPAEATDIRLLVPSNQVPAGERLWSAERLGELAELLFLVQDAFALSVYPEIDPLSLDIEIEVSVDGGILLKQARPYISAY